MSHLYSIYPASVINEYDYPAEFDAAKLSLERRIAQGGMMANWPASWALCLAARFKDRSLATHLLAQTTTKLSANMFVAQYKQIDSILGYAAGIGEMLLQCHNGYIELLPTPAYGWVNGMFKGMRTRSGFEVSAEWKNYRIINATIRSMAGSVCAVKAGGLKGVLTPDGYTIEANESGIVRFDTCRGAEYTLIF